MAPATANCREFLGALGRCASTTAVTSSSDDHAMPSPIDSVATGDGGEFDPGRGPSFIVRAFASLLLPSEDLLDNAAVPCRAAVLGKSGD